jgi:hypothetical protein
MSSAAGGGEGAGSRTFRRTTGSRLAGSACVLLFAGGAASAAAAEGAGPAFLVLLGLTGASLVNLAGVWGDRYLVDEAGIEYRNPLLVRLGRRPRRVGWDEIEDVREVMPRGAAGDGKPIAIFLTPRTGRRMVLDSLEQFDQLLEIVRDRVS